MAKEILLAEEVANNRVKWLNVRKKGIGGTDISAIFGMNKFKSPMRLWQEKAGLIVDDFQEDTWRMYFGRKMEPIIADWFTEFTHKKVRRTGIWCDSNCDYYLATPDRLVVGEDAGLEIKTADVHVAKDWADGGWPEQYWMQCQWYMGVMDVSTWYLVALIGGNDPVLRAIQRDEAAIKNMRRTADVFWECVQNQHFDERFLDGSDSTKQALTQMYNKDLYGVDEVVLLPELNDIAAKLESLDANIKDLTAQKGELQNKVRMAMGNYQVADTGDYRFSWKEQKGRTTFDSKAFKADHEDLYSQYTKQGNPIRVLRMTEVK